VLEENATASHPVFKPVSLRDFQNGDDNLAAEGEHLHERKAGKLRELRTEKVPRPINTLKVSKPN
jgi:hypothetical protein